MLYWEMIKLLFFNEIDSEGALEFLELPDHSESLKFLI